jgi:CelD/BcsL family acetyltransferase involved in cellulose biosynthesis
MTRTGSGSEAVIIDSNLHVPGFAQSLETFIQRYGGDTLYYDPAWIKLITSLYGYQYFPLSAIGSDGHVTGFLPLCYMSSPLTGKRLVSLPFSDCCPLLAEDAGSAGQLIEQALELAKQKQVRYLELRTGHHEALDSRDDLVSTNMYGNWLVKLETNSDIAWKRAHQQARRNVKKARAEGVSVRLAERREEMREYYRLHLLTRTRKHGMPSQPLKYFERLWDAFAPAGKLHLELAEYQGKVIAAHITGLAGKQARYLYGASDERYNKLGAGYLLTWESIQRTGQLGYEVLDLGRTAYDNPGLVQSKRSWGATEQACPYYYYPAIRGLATTGEQSKKYQLVTACWRKLPLQISAPLGGLLYRHLG